MSARSIVALGTGLVFAFLGAVHVWWAWSGVGSGGSGIPEVGGKPAFRPTRLATMLVAAGLGIAAGAVLVAGGMLPSPVPDPVVRGGVLVLGILFVLRAIGDFKLVGFFKRIRDTRFARADTRYYSPLCLALGVAALWLAATGR